MRWFRKAALGTILLTTIMALGLAGGIIHMCSNTSEAKSMQSDPVYNNTIGIYIAICIIQFLLLPLCIMSFCVAYMNWRNNYQMDHSQRIRFISWLCMWSIVSLINLSVAIFVIVRAKEPQEEMAGLYEIFAKRNQDRQFIGHFEKYQRENSCCGIYGPDDWLMVQLRSGMAGGGSAGAGGGFQSLDYGFRQNPSTGNCHLQPPTIPMGCGRKLIDEIHYVMDFVAAIMIFETLVALIAGGFAGYCFFYWLEKEVIVIPEDEVSNLIIIEPESSTSTTFSGAGGYLPQSGYVGAYEDEYFPPPPPAYPYGSRSRGPSYIGSYRPSLGPRRTGYYGSDPNYYNGPPPPQAYQQGLGGTSHVASTAAGAPPYNAPGGIDPVVGTSRSAGPPQGPGGLLPETAVPETVGLYDAYYRPTDKPWYMSNRDMVMGRDQGVGYMYSNPTRQEFYVQQRREHRSRNVDDRSSDRSRNMDDRASHRSRNMDDRSSVRSRNMDDRSSVRSRNMDDRSSVRSRNMDDRSSVRSRNMDDRSSVKSRNMDDRSSVKSRNMDDRPSHRSRNMDDKPSLKCRREDPMPNHQSRHIDPVADRIERRMEIDRNKLHSFNRMVQDQQRILGGRIVGETRVNHNKDEDTTSDIMERHGHGHHHHHDHKPRHATLAIVHNSKSPKPKKLLAINDLNDDDDRAERERE